MMQRAIELSRCGFPAPNPHVGCVIGRQGTIVGEGWHDHAGGPHAEVVALQQAGALAAGADVYVTLEPCNHFGRTGPCSQALIAANVSSVTYAIADPNPAAAGGAEALRNAGIEVRASEGAAAAREANRVWLNAMETGLPYVVVKAATTKDGYLAREDGTSKWITGESARLEGHRLRAELGAVMVGVSTLLADDPELTARIPDVVNQPVKIVLDPNGRSTGNERLWSAGRTLHVVGPGARSFGERLEMDIGPSGTFDLCAVMREIRNRGVIGVLVEGGAKTYAEVFHSGLVQEIHYFVAPISWGAGLSWVQNDLKSELESDKWEWVPGVQVGVDEHRVARRRESARNGLAVKRVK